MDSAPARQPRPSPLLRFALRFAVPLALAALLTACPGGGRLEDSQAYIPETCDPSPTFLEKCDGIFCHGGAPGMQPSGGVELITPPAGMTIGESIYNVEGFYLGPTSANCPPTVRDLLINGDNPQESLFLKKLDGRFTCGTEMPPSPTSLTEAELACIVAWVNHTALTGGN